MCQDLILLVKNHLNIEQQSVSLVLQLEDPSIKQTDEHKKTKRGSMDILRNHRISQCIRYFSLILFSYILFPMHQLFQFNGLVFLA